MNVAAEQQQQQQQRRRREEPYLPEPERKRVCRRLERAPQEISVCHPQSKCVMDYWDMDEYLKQKDPIELLHTQIVKEKPNSMIFPDNETRIPSQPCPRCIAGEPGHFGHIMGL